MIDPIVEWVTEDLTWGGVVFGASLFLATLVGSLLVVSVLLVKLPVTYFQDFHSRDFWVGRPSALRLTARIGKNSWASFWWWWASSDRRPSTHFASDPPPAGSDSAVSLPPRRG